MLVPTNLDISIDTPKDTPSDGLVYQPDSISLSSDSCAAPEDCKPTPIEPRPSRL